MIVLKFFEYFRFAGTLSLVAWVYAAVWTAKSRYQPRRWRCLFAALAAALVAWAFGEINSAGISNATLDRRDEIAAATAEAAAVAADTAAADAAAKAEEEGEDIEVQINANFAEGTSEAPPSMAPAGTNAAAMSPAGTNAAAGVGAAEPAYRQGGKQTRTEGTKESLDGAVDKVDTESEHVRYMKADDLIAAKVMDRLNRFMIRLILLACYGLMLWDYLKAFNATLTTSWLLPVGGRWLDSFSPRGRMVLVTPRAAAGRLPPEYYAESVLRKREQLIYFGPGDPWPQNDTLARVRIKSWIAWGVRKLTAGAPGIPSETEFLLDGAWFGHYAVLVTGGSEANTVLAELVDLLWRRHDTGASARSAVHLVWSLPEPPRAETVTQLRRIADDTNVKLAIWSHDERVPAEFRETFDEVYDEPLEPEVRLRDTLMAMFDEVRNRAQQTAGGA